MFNNLRDILIRKSDQSRDERTDSSALPNVIENEDSSTSATEGFICPLCISGFPNADELQNHYESSHFEGISSIIGDGRSTFSCSACKMKLGSDIELQSHYSRHHAATKEQLEEIANLKADCCETTLKNQRLEQEIQDAKKKIQQLELVQPNVQEILLKLRTEVLDLKQEIVDTKAEKMTLEKRLKKFSNYDDLKQKLEEHKVLLVEQQKLSLEREHQVETLKTELKNTKAEVQNMKIGQEKMFSKIEAGEETSIAIMQFKEENVHQSIKLEKESIDAYKEQFDKIMVSKDEVIQDKNEELSCLRTKLRLLSEEMEQENRQKEESANIIQNLKICLENTKVRLNNMENDASNSEAAFLENIQNIENLSKEKVENQRKIEELSTALHNMCEVKDELSTKIRLHDADIAHLNSQIETYNVQKSHVQKELDAVKFDLEKSEIICQEQVTKISELKNWLTAEKEAHDEDMKELKNTKELIISQKLNFQKEIEEIEQRFVKDIEAKDGIIDDCRSMYNKLKQEKDLGYSKMKEMETECVLKDKKLEQSVSDNQAQIGILSENVSTLQEDLELERSQCKQLKEKLVDLSGGKLELEAKLKIAEEDRRVLLDRCRKSEDENENLLKRNTELHRKLDDSTAALHELGRENQTLQVENMKHLGRKWADDSEATHCRACGNHFTVTVRKHHCRNCGDIFCNECSSKTATVASSRKPVRVCQVCYTELSK